MQQLPDGTAVVDRIKKMIGNRESMRMSSTETFRKNPLPLDVLKEVCQQYNPTENRAHIPQILSGLAPRAWWTSSSG